MSERLLEIKNLGIQFNTDEGLIDAARDVSLSVNRGEVLGLVGESGSGKSITARSIMRLLPGNARISPNSRVELTVGNERLDVLKLRGPQVKRVRGDLVSMIFQEPMASFAPAIRISDQIVQTMQIHTGCSEEQARKRGIELFERVGIREPQKRFDQYVFELSGGMRQRAMIAMALSTEPKLLIADEPTTALDVTIQAQVLELLLELREQLGMSMIFITHDLGVISEIADRVNVMQQGQIVESGAVDRVLFEPQHNYTRRLIDALPDIETLPEQRTRSEENLVSVKDIRIEYEVSSTGFGHETFTAIESMSLDIKRGDILGLVGESGSGKSSLGKALLGAIGLSNGNISLTSSTQSIEFSAKTKPKRKALSRFAQLVFQDPYSSLNPRMTVRDIIAEPLEAMKLTKNRKETDQRVLEVARLCKIEVSHLRRFPHAFSGGQRQRISIARALVCKPEFIVADESVAALDVSIQAEILNLFRQLRDELGLTILFISHDLSVIANLCDHVCVMRNGALVEQGSVRDIFLNPKHEYTQLLISAIPLISNRKAKLEVAI